jgi:hypothetical protein
LPRVLTNNIAGTSLSLIHYGEIIPHLYFPNKYFLCI